MACPTVQYFFSTLSHKRYDFRKIVTEHKMCVWSFCITFVWNIFHSKNKWARYVQKCIPVFMYSTSCSCQISIKLKYSQRNFVQDCNITFHRNPSSGSWVVPWGRTDTTTLIVAFRNSANANKNLTQLNNRLTFKHNEFWQLNHLNKKVKVTLVQALRLCTGRTAHRGSRGIALLFNDRRH